ncbi:hypothetical protein ACTXT7_016412 [Hymenolepis weldensis]
MPKLMVTKELKKAFELLRRKLQDNSQTWIATKRNNFVVKSSYLAEHNAELFKFRKVSSELNINTSKLARDLNLITEKLHIAKFRLKLS